MGIRPRLAFIMGVDDLLVTSDTTIVDPRFHIPDHAPLDLALEHGIDWWRFFNWDDPRGRFQLPPKPTEGDLSKPDWERRMRDILIRSSLLEREHGHHHVHGTAEQLKGDIMAMLYDNYALGGTIEIPQVGQANREELGLELLAILEDHLTPKEPLPRRIDDVIYWREEGGCPNVLGVEIDDGNSYNEMWLWALCIAQGWMTPGYLRLPLCDLKDDMSVGARVLKMDRILREKGVTLKKPKDAEQKRWRCERELEARRKLKLLKRGWNVPSLTLEVEGWAAYALYALRYIGFDIRQADLRLMLTWSWS